MRNTQTWQEALVVATRDLTPTVREFDIRPAEGTPAPWDAGAHMQVQLLVNSQVQTRCYSLVGLPDGVSYRIAVKRMDDGRGGSRAMWQLAVGDRLQVSEPQNHFQLDLSAPHYLLVAGGIGITPLVMMAQQLRAHALKTGATLRMLYGVRTQEELAFLPLLREALGDALQTFVSERGEVMDLAGEIAALPAGAQLYTCGPVAMLEALRKAWAQAGRPAANLRFETFGSSGRFAAQAFRVLVPRQHIDIMVPAGSTLLDALESAGVETLSDCRRGECGLCAMDVLALEGEADHRDVFLSEHEKQQCSRICACVSRVVGSVTLDSAYRAD
ncbi:PDR/VanB family oxidoreductase [Polaromonas sp. A23]|uniref:PDR/VanB family oxidoreductase n=1 Tax=Polaromonas sp. A23 TaxID=1944133 RepID=UPI0009856FBF|nr:PDR/VanB family oxidoreductase [Polaromonas sp. A23]OOG47388.1 oxidoreductase [Polaromonas sp. A23]